MKILSKIYLLGLGIVLMQGCGSSADQMASHEGKAEQMENTEPSGQSDSPISTQKKKEQADADVNSFIPSSISRIGKIDSVKRFIRTADIKFKVKNVERSTYAIEDIVARFDGFVVNTNLNCSVNYSTEFRIKEDSVLQRKHYVVENSIVFRVPNTLLDTTLKQVASQINFLDYRIVKAEDVSFKALKNRLSEKRLSKHQKRLTTAINSNKTKDIVAAENNLFSKEEQADENEIADLELNDKVHYSTVQLLIYQDEKIKEERVFSEQRTPCYKTSFIKEFAASVKFGWELIEFLILLIIKLWPFILIGFAVYFAVKKWRKKA